jgi:hypothetical protein
MTSLDLHEECAECHEVMGSRQLAHLIPEGQSPTSKLSDSAYRGSSALSVICYLVVRTAKTLGCQPPGNGEHQPKWCKTPSPIVKKRKKIPRSAAAKNLTSKGVEMCCRYNLAKSSLWQH